MAGQVNITIGDKEWLASISSTYWELVQGLGGIPEIETGTGMLFDLGFAQDITVTTEPMFFPLDIAFLSEDMVITEIYRDVQPGYLVHATIPSRYFIEVNAGELEDIEEGTQASFELLALVSTVEASDWMTPMISLMGFTLVGVFAVSLVRDLVKEQPEEVRHLRLVKSSQSDAGLLDPRRFPKRTESLNRLGSYEVVHVHDDGDLTVRSHGKLYVVTTGGEVFKQEADLYDSPNQVAGACERISPQYYGLLRWVGVPLPDYSFAIESEVKERKIDEVLKRLKEGVDDIQQSDNFRTFLLTMSKFHDYSIGNLILIMLQKPDATRVAGYSTWKDLYRWVKKGEKGIAILAPCMPPKKKILEPSESENAQDEEETEIRPIYFKVVHVFDVSQTEGKPLPEFEVPPLTGEANEKLCEQVIQLAESQGLEVSFESKPDQDPDIKGYYTGKTIWVRPEETRAQQLKTLLHEVAHYYSEGVFRIPRSDAETIAESVAFTIGAHYGFDTGARSFPYVAIWSKDKKVLEANLAAIRKVADKIFDGLEQAVKKPVGVA